MTKFARDEFDRVPQSPSRQGVHRAITAPSRPALWPVLALGVLALSVGLLAFFIFPKLGFTVPQASTSISQQGAVEGTAPSSAPSDPASQPVASTEPSAVPSTEPSASATPSASAAPSDLSVDKSTAVSVYNATTTSGLAGRVAGMVEGGGWPLSTVGNWGGLPQRNSVIFYNSLAQKGNAQALATLLGIANVVESLEIQQPLVVVLGPGYA
ncbi:LytR C-terminal domain-containing protein [Arthrobacter cavernae]|uniref:LytR C-terminal domain-containing protein n=1 Tax=Arthrobacter cavernae TaxID=2817681 RepID=A0A939HGG6_9MICC|nr:LytR C-terminal domain-containing protein [Arthrobacter cavernae]MBO1267547.1 LytR C-terminal domain-containing protein [Arthrobacter cavernae]